MPWKGNRLRARGGKQGAGYNSWRAVALLLNLVHKESLTYEKWLGFPPFILFEQERKYNWGNGIEEYPGLFVIKHGMRFATLNLNISGWVCDCGEGTFGVSFKALMENDRGRANHFSFLLKLKLRRWWCGSLRLKVRSDFWNVIIVISKWCMATYADSQAHQGSLK